ncbi:hypothetical protein B0H11DRAFT_2253029 [Mycena galericulata]|nr:hypothetical protein B0H11DRAFT_2253029 [Mycena galericulata]
MPSGGKGSKDLTRSVQQQKKAVKRREAGRLYYASHPEAREKSRLRMAAKRLSQKLYRRQWDPPKAKKRIDDPADGAELGSSTDENLHEDESVARAALRTLSQKRQTSDTAAKEGGREPMSLTDIDRCESSESSVRSICDEDVVARQRLERQIRNLAADDAYNSSEEAQQELLLAGVAAEKKMQEEEQQRQQQMRWLVNSGPSAEDLYLVGGSLKVRAWLRELEEPES